jgi:hypothetical protein
MNFVATLQTAGEFLLSVDLEGSCCGGLTARGRPQPFLYWSLRDRPLESLVPVATIHLSLRSKPLENFFLASTLKAPVAAG